MTLQDVKFILDRMIKDEYESKENLTPLWHTLCVWKDLVSDQITANKTGFHKHKRRIYRIQNKHSHNLMISKLVEYVLKYATRGECQCGKCIDRVDNPQDKQPTGHTSDLYFFKVALKKANDETEADASTLRKLIEESTHGDFADCNPLGGKEHSYIELGAWIGDQGLAFMFMGMCDILGLGKVMTPNALPIPDELKQQMAGAGMVSFFGTIEQPKETADK